MQPPALRPKKRRTERPTYSNDQMRRRVGIAILLASWIGLAWFFKPGIPVLWEPKASAAVKEEGRVLFEHEWVANDPLAKGDGLGPVFNHSSCVACHHQGGVGGGGGKTFNVMSYEVRPTPRDKVLRTGVIHADAVDPAAKESFQLLRSRNPIQRNVATVANHCDTVIPEFDPVRVTPIQTTALWGDGWIDRISGKAITYNQMHRSLNNAAREFALDFDQIPAGRARILPDGRVGKFGWKAQFATLEEFVATACANELGLGTPTVAQATSFAKPDQAKVAPDLDRNQVRALAAFCDTLPRPIEVEPAGPIEQQRAARGKQLFRTVGCAVCHTPDLGGVNGIYSDFLLHSIDDPVPGGNYDPDPEPDFPFGAEPRASEWKTPALWGVADSAPYLHDGSAKTLRDAILRHKGDAKLVTATYEKLNPADQEAFIAFLNTLKAPPTALEVERPEVVYGKKK